MVTKDTAAFLRKSKKGWSFPKGQEAVPFFRIKKLLNNISQPNSMLYAQKRFDNERQIKTSLFSLAAKTGVRSAHLERFVDAYMEQVEGKYSKRDFVPSDLRCALLQHLRVHYKDDKPRGFLPFPDFCIMYPPKIEFELTTPRANGKRKRAILKQVTAWMEFNANRGFFSCGLSRRTLAFALGCGKSTADFYLDDFVKQGRLIIAKKGETKLGGKATEYCLPEHLFELLGKEVEEKWASSDDEDWEATFDFQSQDTTKFAPLDDEEAAELEAYADSLRESGQASLETCTNDDDDDTDLATLLREFDDYCEREAKDDQPPSHISHFDFGRWPLAKKFSTEAAGVSS